MLNDSYETKINNLKECVSQMKARDESVLWADALCLFDYVINLSPQDFLNIRFHSGYITGTNILQHYYQYPQPDADKYAESVGYKFYTKDVPEKYWLSEPEMPRLSGKLGVNYKNRIVNQDVSRYQSCVSNLYSTGIFNKLHGGIVVEIGGGYGGLAHYFGQITKTTYIIVDLPEMLLFSGGFLIVNNPGKKIYVYNKNTFSKDFLTQEIYNWDYVLLPNYILQDLYALKEINLFINMQSFQEMTKQQVDEYLRFAKDKLNGVLYSDNMDRHPFNDELKSVSEILDEHFNLLPSSKFYNFGNNDPWMYKIYIASTENIIQAQIKFVHWMSKYTLSFQNNNLKCKKEQSLFSLVIILGLKILRMVFRI